MSKSFGLAIAFAAAVTAAAPSAGAATLLKVGPSDLCGSSGCFSATSRIFTQSFSAAGRVSGLELARSVVGDMQNNAVRISVTRSDGTVVASWGSYLLAAVGGDVVTINGEAIDWDANAGDLVLRLELLLPSKGGLGGWGGGGGGVFAGGGGGGGPFSAPPITQTPPPLSGAMPGSILGNVLAVAVPEPATWALMIAGFGLAGVSLRVRRRAIQA